MKEGAIGRMEQPMEEWNKAFGLEEDERHEETRSRVSGLDFEIFSRSAVEDSKLI